MDQSAAANIADPICERPSALQDWHSILGCTDKNLLLKSAHRAGAALLQSPRMLLIRSLNRLCRGQPASTFLLFSAASLHSLSFYAAASDMDTMHTRIVIAQVLTRACTGNLLK